MKSRLIIALTIIVIVIVTISATLLRFDFAGGSHRITPTAVDQDFWGNWKVYYRSPNSYVGEAEERFYYIEKGNQEIHDQIQEAIQNNWNVMVYYERWVGFKGIGSPKESPIIKVEPVF